MGPERAFDRSRMLLEAGVALASELSLPAVLQRIVELAAEVTDARYGALGVLGPEGKILEFVTAGVTAEERKAIGHIPEGRGILGALIQDVSPLRLRRIEDDPRSVGFPPNHPRMESFLGAPVMARGQVFGNIYLTEKRGAQEFDGDDEEALVILATQAGVAVQNAWLYEETRQRERWLAAVRQIATAILSGLDVEYVLQLVAERARELVGGDLATVVTPDVGDEMLVLRVAAGEYAAELQGTRFPAEGTINGDVIRTGRPVVLSDASVEERVDEPIVKMGGIGPLLLVPLSVRGRPFGTLAVANRLDGRMFGQDDLRLMESFADQAAVALEYERVQRELKRLAVMEDRERIAKELHDGAIQSLFAVGLGLQGTATMIGNQAISHRIEGAVEEVDRVIRDLRNYIFGLRPGILADRQLDQALRDLAREFEERTGITTVIDVDGATAAELSSRAGDIVQLTREALSNVGRHSGASTCRVSLRRTGRLALLEIDDDGHGFDQAAVDGRGLGIRNLRERAESLGGELGIESSPREGSNVRVSIPL